jgi:hypothetical protein
MLADLLWAIPAFALCAAFAFDTTADAPHAPPPAEAIGCDFD